MIRSIVTSIAITSVVAAIGGLLFNYIFDYHLIKSIICTFLVQIVIFYVWNSISQMILTIRVEQEQTRQAEMLSQQGIDVVCAHCKSENFVPIRLDESNEFACDKCGKENSIYIDISIAQKARILDRDQLSVNYIKDKLDESKKVK